MKLVQSHLNPVKIPCQARDDKIDFYDDTKSCGIIYLGRLLQSMEIVGSGGAGNLVATNG